MSRAVFVARLIARMAPTGKSRVGRLIDLIMAGTSASQNQRAIDALEISSSDHVLDIGCGSGRSLEALAARARDGRVVGADPSALMAKLAAKRARHAEVIMASAACLPFENGAFDKALCVHVIYFWNDLDAAFAEIARVLKPGARFALLFRTGAEANRVRAFPAEVYRFHAPRDVIAPLEEAGFAVEAQDQLCCETGTSPLLILATRRATAAKAA